MSAPGGPPNEATYKLKWRCGDVDCDHIDGCRRQVLWTDSGHVEIRGEMVWNKDDRQWDWSVAVDHYGSSNMTQLQVEAMVARHARRMASQVGMQFRGRKVMALATEPDDED